MQRPRGLNIRVRIARLLDRLHKEAVVAVTDYAVWYQGHLACPCQVEWFPVFELEAQRLGFLDGPLPLSQIIGGAITSGGTHTSGGADDTYPLTTVKDVPGYVWLSRQMGADATWERPANWDGRGGVRHIHRVLTGCPHNAPAAYQIDDVRAGMNGLAGSSRGPDDGPRPLSGRTYKQGIAWTKEQQAKEWDEMATKDEIKDAVREVVREELAKEQANGRSVKQNILAICRALKIKPAED